LLFALSGERSEPVENCTTSYSFSLGKLKFAVQISPISRESVKAGGAIPGVA
jgi:hypothetical protein